MVKQVYRRLKKIHLVGIGGTGMSGIAEVLLNLGYRVSGSDLQANEATERLRQFGAEINIGHRKENVLGADVVVISSAIRPDNVEVKEARQLKIPVIPRAEMLAELMRMKYGVAVAGSHGKTTTTSMIALVLEAGGFDPTIVVGGRLNKIGSHGKLGTGDFMVAEADESDRSFLYLSPFIAVLTNIDFEHLDHYHNLDDLKKTFVDFANKVPFYCPVILCLDDPNLQDLIPKIERKIITYGFSAQADIFARSLRFVGFESWANLFYQGQPMGELHLHVPGWHNVLNAMAAVAVGLDLDIPLSAILKALENYSGTGRRFELKATLNQIMIIEDYAHHPTEIRATLEAAKQGFHRRLVVIFQPHRYTRLYHLLKSFAMCFNQADVLVLTEVYPAGEDPIPGINGQALYEAIQEYGHKNVIYEPDMDRIPEIITRLVLPEDMILVLGAGNIPRIIPEIINRLEVEVKK